MRFCVEGGGAGGFEGGFTKAGWWLRSTFGVSAQRRIAGVQAIRTPCLRPTHNGHKRRKRNEHVHSDGGLGTGHAPAASHLRRKASTLWRAGLVGGEWALCVGMGYSVLDAGHGGVVPVSCAEIPPAQRDTQSFA